MESKKGRTCYCLRCKKCGYDESVTANTVFHAIKMPILKAFHMAFRLTAKKKGMSTVELGPEVGVGQKTAWLFKRKMQSEMKEGGKDKLKHHVQHLMPISKSLYFIIAVIFAYTLNKIVMRQKLNKLRKNILS
jgi:hypothetical protein